MSPALSTLLSVLAFVWVLVVISPQTYRPLMLLITVWAIVRSTPTKGRYGPAVDAAWVAAALFSLGWPLAQSEAFFNRAASPLPGDLVAGTGAIIVVFEATRRTIGWIGPVAGAVMLSWAALRGVPRLIGQLFMTLNGMYGVPLGVASTYLVILAVGISFLLAGGDWLSPRRFLLALTTGGRRALPLIAIAAVFGMIVAAARL